MHTLQEAGLSRAEILGLPRLAGVQRLIRLIETPKLLQIQADTRLRRRGMTSPIQSRAWPDRHASGEVFCSATGPTAAYLASNLSFFGGFEDLKSLQTDGGTFTWVFFFSLDNPSAIPTSAVTS